MTRWSLLSLFNRRGPAPLLAARGVAPRGWFRLSGETVIGLALGDNLDFPHDMLIDVVRGQSVLASCSATPNPNEGTYAFTLPIEGRFTGKELLEESVTIIAHDRFGNRGRLKLNGAAQLELIREHLGPPVDVILDLNFGRDGNARLYLNSGWQAASANATWTANYDSFISFDTPVQPGTYALRFTASAYISKPNLPQQNLDVFVHDRHIMSFIVRQPGVQFQECRFLREEFGSLPRAILRFHHPNAARPSDVDGSTDGHRYAFAFNRLTLVRFIGIDQRAKTKLR